MTNTSQARDLYEVANVDIVVRLARPERDLVHGYSSESHQDGPSMADLNKLKELFDNIARRRRAIFHDKLYLRGATSQLGPTPPSYQAANTSSENANPLYLACEKTELPQDVLSYLLAVDAPETVILEVEHIFLSHGDKDGLLSALEALELPSRHKLAISTLMLRELKKSMFFQYSTIM